MQNLLEDLKELLQQDERLVVDGKLLKNKIIELALQLDASLIRMLLKNESIKKHFFQDVDGLLVFDKLKFQKFVSNKAFLPDSYTSFKNKIGLLDEDEYLKENKSVVLAWPYKDCVLEGKQSDEDEKLNEFFWNETLAPDEIDRLFSSKVLSNFKEFTPEKNNHVEVISKDSNLLIKGNNLLSLHSLQKRFTSQIKLIYIDPPYNTGNDSFGYNDNFNHSSWLTFFKNRIEAAYPLLSREGSIWINLDDTEAHYAKIICDEIFGRENFIANVIWQKKYAPQNDARFFSDNHDHILVYAKNIQYFKLNLLPRSAEMDSRYKNPDDDPRGSWTSDNLLVKTYSKEYDYTITNPVGREINPPNGSCWRVSKQKFEELKEDNRIWFGKDGKNVPRLKRFLTEVQQGSTPLTIWPYNEVGHNQDARRELFALVDTNIFKTPKPEKLIKRVIELGSNEGDYVLDFFAGSGTTPAVALKMKRKFIACEQMDYCESVTIERLKKVLKGEDGGISKEVNWSGGGSFIYCELTKQGQTLLNKITNSTTENEIKEIVNELTKSNLLKFNVNLSLLESDSFNSLSIEGKKAILFESIDKNNLYVSLSEIDDTDHNISTQDKQLNYAFYNI
jgi:adenine-specific DNA-methyltransferase